MQFNLLTLLGISLAALFFGYFFGLFEGRGQGYKRRKTEDEEENTTKGILDAPLPPPGLPVSAAENSLLELSLDDNQQLRLDIDGQRVGTSQLGPEQRKRLIDLMVLIRPWVDASATQKTVPPLQPAARPTSPPPSPAGTRQTPPGTVPPLQARPVPVRAAPGPAAKEEAAPTTMVGQIDAILQARLIGTPLESLGIQLIESAEGGVIVMVGKDRYSGVSDVPDPAVHAAIKAAIAEWEKRYTPGA